MLQNEIKNKKMEIRDILENNWKNSNPTVRSRRSAAHTNIFDPENPMLFIQSAWVSPYKRTRRSHSRKSSRTCPSPELHHEGTISIAGIIY